MNYEDYLHTCSLKDLKREANEYKKFSHLDQGKTIGTLILKLISRRLPKESRTQEIKLDYQKIESDRDRDLKGSYLYIN